MSQRLQPAPPVQPELIALPAFADNYIWLLHAHGRAWVVDPGEAPPVLACLQALDLQLEGILVTHHHADHVGGIQALRANLQGKVWGPARERIPEPFEALREGDVVPVLGLAFRVLEVPGHTAGHIAYAQQGESRQPLLFCGDTLFSAGCGRLFEGTPAQMLHSLGRLAALPDDTRVCCTHEYTLGNLRFAAAVEPDNAAVQAHTRHCRRLREQDLPTLPSSLGLEKAINPFLRCEQPAVRASAALHAGVDVASAGPAQDSVAVFATLREWKNQYR